jgi:putative zinc finger/helix-turn-helix YgiT family protein
MKQCFSCHSDRIISSIELEDYSFGEVTFSVEMPCVRCEACGETTTAHGDGEKADAAVAHALALNGPMTGAAFRHMRNVLNISRAEMASLLDVAPETVSRWEVEGRPVDRAAWLLLSTIVEEHEAGRTTTLARLRKVTSEKSDAPLMRRLALAG